MEKRDRYGAFLLYVDDWLSSTAIDLMTAAEERGYLRLLLHCWKAEDCGIPDDDDVLARLAKLGRTKNVHSLATLRAQFTARDGRLFNERLLREREYQKEVRAKRSTAAAAGNDARWGRKRIANGSQNDPNPNPKPESKRQAIRRIDSSSGVGYRFRAAQTAGVSSANL